MLHGFSQIKHNGFAYGLVAGFNVQIFQNRGALVWKTLYELPIQSNELYTLLPTVLIHSDFEVAQDINSFRQIFYALD